jgi:hypothetical protein
VAPYTGQFKVCFEDCPTGYTKDDSTSPKSCTEVRTKIVEYDLTYIERPFKNLAAEGVNTGALGSTKGAAFKDTLPYKLRGAYSDGVDRGIFIPSLNLHHSLSISVWFYLTDNTAERALFAKEKNDYAAADKENLFEFVALTGGKLAVHIYLDATDHCQTSGGDPCATDAAAISTDVWTYAVVTLAFDGQNTEVKFYINSSAVAKTVTASNVFLEDRDAFPNAWLLMTTKESSGAGVPDKVWKVYLYHFTLNNKTITAADVGGDIETDHT